MHQCPCHQYYNEQIMHIGKISSFKSPSFHRLVRFRSSGDVSYFNICLEKFIFRRFPIVSQCAVSNAIHLKALSHSLCKHAVGVRQGITHHYYYITSFEGKLPPRLGVGGYGEKTMIVSLELVSLLSSTGSDNPDFCLQIHVQQLSGK